MNQWLFVFSAYAVALAGTGSLLTWSWWTMRRAEAAADDLTRR